MKSLSLRVQIFLLVALAVLAVAATSFRSTWTFLLQDKLASVRELQTLSLVTTLQDMRVQSESLREELRSVAVGLYRRPEQIGVPFSDIKSPKGSYSWKEVVLSPASKSHGSLSSKSLIFDPAASISTAPATKEQNWSYSIVQEDGKNYLQIEDPLSLGQDGKEHILRGKVSVEVLGSVLEKLQFQSIDIHLYTHDPISRALKMVTSPSSNDIFYTERIQQELASEAAQNQNIEGHSISLSHNDEKSFVSFAKLRLPGGESNMLLAFVAKESRLVSEFRAFLAEQTFILLGILGAALLAGFFVTRLITKPVTELVDATRDLERGQFHRRVAVEAHNEIGRLASAFNHLGKTLQDREEALETAEKQRRQLSFQTAVFKRLTEFTDRIAKILNPAELEAALIESWAPLLGLSREENHLAFYRFDSKSRRHVLHSHGAQSAKFPSELGPELWNSSLDFDGSTYEILDAEVLERLPLHDAQERVFRLPITGENKIHGILVFTAREVQDSEYFEMLMIECQRLLSTNFEAAHRYADLQEASIRDGLTGLFNVRFFKECFQKELSKAATQGEHLSFLFFDVDHFKKYNDTHGHPAGDRVLKQVASLMRASFDPKDVVARYGGEEFVILLKNTDHKTAMLHAERFRAIIAESKFENEETQPLGFVSVSIGVSTYPEHAQDMASLIKIADDALYQGKKASRNVVVSADSVVKTPQNSAA